MLGALAQCPPALLTQPRCPCPLQLASGVNSGQALGIEIIATLQLVLCVLATTDRRRRDLGGSAPLAIGLSVALGHLLAVSVGPSRVGAVGRVGPGSGCRVPCCGQWEGPPTGLLPWGTMSSLGPGPWGQGGGFMSCPRQGGTVTFWPSFWVHVLLSSWF